MDLSKIKLGYSSLDQGIYLYRHGKKPNEALDKRKAEGDVMAVFTEMMMDSTPKGSVKKYRIEEKYYRVTLEPLASENSQEKPCKHPVDTIFDRLVKFIHHWAGHEYNCDCLDNGSPRTDCTCGYDKARDQVIAEAKES